MSVNSRRLLKIFSLVIAVGVVGSLQNASARGMDEDFGEAFSRHKIKPVAVKRSRTHRRVKKSNRSAQNTTKYKSLIASHARRQGVPVRLALAVVRVESNYNPRARGRAGEIGLMQLMPRTARGIGYRGSMNNLYNPSTNLYWGMKYLSAAYKKSGGNLCGTIMRYNGGLYAKKISRTAANYCQRVKVIMRQG